MHYHDLRRTCLALENMAIDGAGKAQSRHPMSLMYTVTPNWLVRLSSQLFCRGLLLVDRVMTAKRISMLLRAKPVSQHPKCFDEILVKVLK